VLGIAEGFQTSIEEMGGGGAKVQSCPWYAFNSEIVQDVMQQNIIGQTNPALKLHEGLPAPLFAAVIEWTKRSNGAERLVREKQEDRRRSEANRSKHGGGASGAYSVRPMRKTGL